MTETSGYQVTKEAPQNLKRAIEEYKAEYEKIILLPSLLIQHGKQFGKQEKIH